MKKQPLDRRSFLLKASSTAGVAAIGHTLPSPVSALGHDTKGTGYVYDALYEEHVIDDGHPESPDRLEEIRLSMKASGLNAKVTPSAPIEDPFPFIRRIHTQNHIDQVDQIPTTGAVAKQAVAGVLGAVKAVSEGEVRNAFCAIRPPGHHAHNSGREEGFCYYANVAVAARYAQLLGHAKILIIDWDYHHGNGTQDAFYNDGSVLFFSTHDSSAYPGTGDENYTGEGEGAGLNINVHLPCGATDADMIAAWDQMLIPAARAFGPDFILISAGFDSRQNDTLGCFDLTDWCFAEMTRKAMALADEFCEGRIVSALEGGYNVTGLASAVVNHVGTLLNHEVDIEWARTRYRAYNKAGMRDGLLHLPGVSWQNVDEVLVHDAAGRRVTRIPRRQIRGPIIDLRKRSMSPGLYITTVAYRGQSPQRYRYHVAQ
ncbi:MAG: histone deacetylase [Chitinivibrionales bacterium]|nr:histone deacetylase [Chitinivibrionales bacterium]MBD3356150.1 histone deacetylase [Chitinivibrionales bacterium]